MIVRTTTLLLFSLLAVVVPVTQAQPNNGRAGNCNDGFECANCLVCKSATAEVDDGGNPTGKYTVVIDGYDCKEGGTISWMCAAAAGVTVDGATDENKNDQGLVEMTVRGVPGDWTTLRVQTKDGQGYGTDTEPLEQCGGGRGLDQTCSGACHTDVDLTSCLPDDNGGGGPPPPSPGSGGDPHFKTWSNEWFDFHGECDLLLIDAPKFQNGLGLQIQVRTTIRHGYSYIQSAAVRIGDDTLQVNSFGDYNINGIFGSEVTFATVADYDVIHEHPSDHIHTFDIMLDDDDANEKGERIHIKTYKDMVSVNLDHATNPNDFVDSIGILGSYNQQGLRLARDGVTIPLDTNTYAMEWQVQPNVDTGGSLFDVVREPQYPTACKMPDLAEREQRRQLRGMDDMISQEDAQQACNHLASQDEKARCVYDVLATQDLDLAIGGAF